jgi:TolB protein
MMILRRRIRTRAFRVILSSFLLVSIHARPATAQESTVRRVIVSWHEGPENIYVVNPNGTLGRRLTSAPEGRGAWVPNFSPDCKDIVFASNMEDGGAASIYIMDPDGSNVRRLTSTEGSDYSPSFSPDGTRIIFLRTTDGRRNVWLMNRDGSEQRQLIPGANESIFYAGALSTDSTQALVSVTPPGAPPLRLQPTVQAAGADLYRVDVGEASAFRLTTVADPAEANFAGVWSRDGTQIAFGSNRDGNWEIFTMSADGSDQRQLTDTHGSSSMSTYSM